MSVNLSKTFLTFSASMLLVAASITSSDARSHRTRPTPTQSEFLLLPFGLQYHARWRLLLLSFYRPAPHVCVLLARRLSPHNLNRAYTARFLRHTRGGSDRNGQARYRGSGEACEGSGAVSPLFLRSRARQGGFRIPNAVSIDPLMLRQEVGQPAASRPAGSFVFRPCPSPG